MFDPQEVRRLAQHVVDSSVYEVERGMNAYLRCEHCHASVYWDGNAEDIAHRGDCLYLVAKDVLT